MTMLRGGMVERAGAGGSGGGSVSSVSVVTANGFSGTVANPTTTPSITINANGLDAAKIADGTISNVEFQYLNGATSNIQQQINNIVVPSINSLQTTVNFGNAGGGEDGMASVTVAAPWVTSGSTIFCNAAGVSTPDHDAEDVALEGITAVATNLNVGVGFDVVARAPQGSWGRFNINVMGV